MRVAMRYVSSSSCRKSVGGRSVFPSHSSPSFVSRCGPACPCARPQVSSTRRRTMFVVVPSGVSVTIKWARLPHSGIGLGWRSTAKAASAFWDTESSLDGSAALRRRQWQGHRPRWLKLKPLPGGPALAPVDSECAAEDGATVDEAEIPAVAAVAPIVAEYEVLADRDGDRAKVGPASFVERNRMCLAEELAELAVIPDDRDVLPIEPQSPTLHGDVVARYGDDPLQKHDTVLGRFEHDDIGAPRAVELIDEADARRADAVADLVD